MRKIVVEPDHGEPPVEAGREGTDRTIALQDKSDRTAASKGEAADKETDSATAAKTEAIDSNIACNDVTATKAETESKNLTAERYWSKAGQESETLLKSGFFQDSSFDGAKSWS